MRNKKLLFYNWAIFISFVFLGFFIGGDLGLLMASDSGPMARFQHDFRVLFFLDNVFSIGLIVLHRLSLQREEADPFRAGLDQGIFPKRALRLHRDRLHPGLGPERAKRKKLKGVVACVGIKNLNSEILSLYGADAVKEINEIVFRCIYEKWVDKREDYLYAFNILDDFLVYKDTDDPQLFYKELKELSE
jgi:hypothetical protein